MPGPEDYQARLRLSYRRTDKVHDARLQDKVPDWVQRHVVRLSRPFYQLFGYDNDNEDGDDDDDNNNNFRGRCKFVCAHGHNHDTAGHRRRMRVQLLQRLLYPRSIRYAALRMHNSAGRCDKDGDGMCDRVTVLELPHRVPFYNDTVGLPQTDAVTSSLVRFQGFLSLSMPI
jgi:hypothetical protein